MEFRTFVDHAATIESISADGEITATVADVLVAAETAIEPAARFLQGRVFPAWSPRTLDVGPQLCYTAIARAAGPNVDTTAVEAAIAETGDVGSAAAQFETSSQRGLHAYSTGGPEVLTVTGVQAELDKIAAASGSGSQQRKADLLFGLLTKATPQERRYLTRLVLGEMRIGVGGGMVRDAIGRAFDVPDSAVERALQVSNDYGLVARRAREDGTDGLARITLTLGRPVQPMLAQAGTAAEALKTWDRVAVETKYDGARVQIHYDGQTVDVFSRNMEPVTASLPEVVETIESACSAPAILDGEVIAVDNDGGALPFQEVLRRFRREHDIEQTRDAVGVELRVFDCLHAPGTDGGVDLLDEPYDRRREYLEQTLGTGIITVRETTDHGAIETHEQNALEAGHEGVLLKNPEAAYTPGRRGKDWLKHKPTVETLDLAIVGAEWGEGRRANLFGTFELAAVDEAAGTFSRVGNVATGLTDAELERLTDRLEPHVTHERGQHVEIRPAVVVEVGYEEIQESPTYEAGYALRFPRVITVREDVDPDAVDTVTRIQSLAD